MNTSPTPTLPTPHGSIAVGHFHNPRRREITVAVLVRNRHGLFHHTVTIDLDKATTAPTPHRPRDLALWVDEQMPTAAVGHHMRRLAA